MEYDVITIDTSVFRAAGLNLEGGILASLDQFSDGVVEFVLSEIVFRELYKHLGIVAREALEAIETKRRKISRSGIFDRETLTTLDALFDKASAPEEAAHSRLLSFVERTSLQIIAAEKTDIKELVRRYFSPDAPFERSGNKKSEFPDAIALLSLEAWAESEQKKILAISKDNGWLDYSMDSRWIDVESDLAIALEKLQLHTEQAKERVVGLLASVDRGERSAFSDKLSDAMAQAVESIEAYGEATSHYYVDGDLAMFTCQNFSFAEDGGSPEITIVQIGRENIVFQTRVEIFANVESSFSLSVWDSIDKEYVPMGRAESEDEIEFEAVALITLQGEFDTDQPDVDIVSVDLDTDIELVDFGEVDLDYGDDSEFEHWHQYVPN